MRFPADIVDMSMTLSSQIFVAGRGNLRTRRSVRSNIGLVMMSLVLTLGVGRAVMAAPRASSQQGALLVQAVDGAGRFSSSADIIDVSGAYPGMPAETSTFEVRNTGTRSMSFALNSRGLAEEGSRSLDDVLRITVRDRSTGAIEYRGRLSALRIEHTGALVAGATATFTVDVTWPNTPADDAYQGAGLRFSVVARPSAA